MTLAESIVNHDIVSKSDTLSVGPEKIAVRNLQGPGKKHLHQHSVSSCRSFQFLPGVACLSLIGNEQRSGQKDRDQEQNNLVEPLHHLVASVCLFYE